MDSSIFPDDFYHKLRKDCEIIDASDIKFIVSSVGKQSLGKSFFLSKIFDERLQTKDGKNISKGTDCFERIEMQKFHLFDMEGLDGSEGNTMRDAFNFFSIMTISDVILLHISHSDLENRMFIKHFAFLIHQAFSPFRSTCLTFRMNLPKVILLIKDPRWDDEELKLWESFEQLVKNFQVILSKKIKKYSNELINFFEKAELANIEKQGNKSKSNEEKKDARSQNNKEIGQLINEENKSESNEKIGPSRSMIEDQYNMFRQREIEFKIDEFYPVYYQQSGFGKNKEINYYKISIKHGKTLIKKSKFKFLINSILNCKPSTSPFNFYQHRSENIFNDEFGEMEGFYKVLRIMEEQRIKETSLVSIISHIYIEVKNDIFFHTENNDELGNFISKYYKIKKDLEKILKSASNRITFNESINYIRNKIKLGPNDFIDEIKIKTEEIFVSILKKNGLLHLKTKIENYFRLQLVKQFNTTFALDSQNTTSLLYSTLFAILNFKNQETIDRQLKKIIDQIKIFQCLWLFDGIFEEILKSTFTKSFKYFDTFTYLICENLKIVKTSLENFELKIDLLPIKAVNSKDLEKNIESFLEPFLDLTSLNEETFISFLSAFRQISKLRILRIMENSLVVLKPYQKVEIIEIEDIIESRDLIYTLFPSISGLLAGIITSVVRNALIAAAAETAGAVAAAASTAWIPIVGWTIFGATTLISIGWIAYKVYKSKQPRTLKRKYKPEAGWKIYKRIINCSVVNGKIENLIPAEPLNAAEINKPPEDCLDFSCTFIKNKENIYSSFAKIIIILLIQQESAVDMN